MFIEKIFKLVLQSRLAKVGVEANPRSILNVFQFHAKLTKIFGRQDFAMNGEVVVRLEVSLLSWTLNCLHRFLCAGDPQRVLSSINFELPEKGDWERSEKFPGQRFVLESGFRHHHMFLWLQQPVPLVLLSLHAWGKDQKFYCQQAICNKIFLPAHNNEDMGKTRFESQSSHKRLPLVDLLQISDQCWCDAARQNRPTNCPDSKTAGRSNFLLSICCRSVASSKVKIPSWNNTFKGNI